MNMKILTYNGKLIEETGYVLDEKVMFFKFLKDEDKEQCPRCEFPIDKEFNIVEDCINWRESIKGVDTIPND